MNRLREGKNDLPQNGLLLSDIARILTRIHRIHWKANACMAYKASASSALKQLEDQHERRMKGMECGSLVAEVRMEEEDALHGDSAIGVRPGCDEG